MSNPLIRFGAIHLLAWALAVPLLLLAVRQSEDMFSSTVCAIVGVTYGYVALTLKPQAVVGWLAERGVWPKLVRLVFAALALIYLGVIVSYPFGTDVYWPMLVAVIAAALCWLSAIAVSLLAKPPVPESL